MKDQKSQDSVVMIGNSNDNLSLKSFVESPQSKHTAKLQDFDSGNDSPHMLPEDDEGMT